LVESSNFQIEKKNSFGRLQFWRVQFSKTIKRKKHFSILNFG